MENLSHSRQPNIVSKRSCNGSTNNKFTYDDVFGGPPRFGAPTLSPRVEDYTEIFGGFHESKASSIPVLDLPLAYNEASEVFFDVRSSGFDYCEVFGGLNGHDFAVSYEELLMMEQSNGFDDSSDDAWTPAEAENLSEESDHSAKDKCLSNGDSCESIDGGIEFDIAYNKASLRRNENLPNGITHITQLQDVSGYTFVVDKGTSLPKTDCKYQNLLGSSDDHLSIDYNGNILTGRHLRKVMSHPANGSTDPFENDFRPHREFVRNGSLPNEGFVTISDVSLKTQPSHLPPPYRPPPALVVKKGDFAKAIPNIENAASEDTPDDNSHYFDVEIDSGSSAAASAASLKDAMDKAQSKLRSAKESMERKREACQTHKLVSKKGTENKAEKATKIVSGSDSRKGSGRQDICQEEHNGIEFLILERPAVKMSSQSIPDSLEGKNHPNAAKRSVEENNGGESLLSQGSDRIDGAGEWKEATQFFEWEINEKRQRENCEMEEHGMRLTEARKIEENEKKQKEAREREENEKRLREAREREENEKRWREAREREENEKRRREAREREENEKRRREAREREENEKRRREAQKRQENEKRRREAREREENEKRQLEAQEREEKEKRQREAQEREENENRRKEAQKREEQEKREREAQEREESERRQREAREREESERRKREAREREEIERRQREAREREEIEMRKREAQEREEIERRNREAREREEIERRKREACEREENERIQREAREREDNEKRQREACERQEFEMRLREAHEREESEKILKEAVEKEENERRLKETLEKEWQREGAVHEEYAKRERKASQRNEMRFKEAFEKEENESRLEVDVEQEENEKGLRETHERKENEKKQRVERSVSYQSRKLDDDKNLGATQLTGMHEGNNEKLESDKEFVQETSKRLSEQRNGEKGVASIMEHERSQIANKHVTSIEQMVENDKSTFQVDLDVGNQAKKSTYEKCERGKNIEHTQACSNQVNKKDDSVSARVVKEPVELGKKLGGAQPTILEVKGSIPRTTQQINAGQSIDRKMKSCESLSSEYKEAAERMKRERDIEMERLRKLEEEREREREREKDRMALDRTTLEIRENRERAERAAVERVTAEARQRALNEARERLEKACAEAREKSLPDKASMEARLRAERAAVERATAEVRERAFEKAVAERATFEARERVERSVSDKFSSSSRSSGMRSSSPTSDRQDMQYQVAGSFSGSRYQYSTVYSERSEAVEGESPQRCKARLERYRRTSERAAKALAEKNMRDLLAQREQAERNRLAETLDAEVKRWSSGKEGNLRALLSTLQYILGSDSGWQPVPLTEVITAAAVKKAYRKATLCVHPDKLQQRGASIQQKYICEKVFDLLKEGWNKFNSEER